MPSTNPLALTPEIDAFRVAFERIAADADTLVTPLSDRQFNWQPRPDAWSVAQCLDHLNATARQYLPMLDEGIADAIRRGLYSPGPYTYNWIGRLMVYVVRPQTRMKAKAPQAFQPPAGRTRSEVTAAFRAYQVQYVDRLRQANGLDLGRARARSPIIQMLKMPLGSAFEMMVAHEQRHLGQARRVTQMIEFPR